MKLDRFTELRKQRNVPIEECAMVAGITRQHLVRCIKDDTLKVNQIKNLCRLLRIKHTFFFEE